MSSHKKNKSKNNTDEQKDDAQKTKETESYSKPILSGKLNIIGDVKQKDKVKKEDDKNEKSKRKSKKSKSRKVISSSSESDSESDSDNGKSTTGRKGTENEDKDNKEVKLKTKAVGLTNLEVSENKVLSSKKDDKLQAAKLKDSTKSENVKEEVKKDLKLIKSDETKTIDETDVTKEKTLTNEVTLQSDKNKELTEPIFPNVDSMLALKKFNSNMLDQTEMMRLKVKAIISEIKLSDMDKSKTQSFCKGLSLRTTRRIPRFFDIEYIRSNFNEDIPTLRTHSDLPQYLEESFKAYSYGLNEAIVTFKSVDVTPQIIFSPSDRSVLSKTLGSSSLNIEKQGFARLDYVYACIETMLKMIMGAQVIIEKPEELMIYNVDIAERDDPVGSLGMIKSKFINQKFPIGLAAGYKNTATWLAKILLDIYENPELHMLLGEDVKETFGNIKFLSEYGVITDQYFSQMNRVYINYLRQHKPNPEDYLAQFQFLTFEGVMFEFVSVPKYYGSFVAFPSRDECDGCLVLVTISSKRQEQYVLHLRDLLQETQLIKIYDGSELRTLDVIIQPKDPDFQGLINGISNEFSDANIYEVLAYEMMTTWIDVFILIRYRNWSSVDHLLIIWVILLWYIMFPAIAIDNSNTLMYHLFNSLSYLLRNKTESYLKVHGFVIIDGKKNERILSVNDLEYRMGRCEYPLLAKRPIESHKIFYSIHEIINHGKGITTRSRDTEKFITPRMHARREYYQPWNFEGIVEPGAQSHGTECSVIYTKIKDLMMEINRLFNKSKSPFTSKSMQPGSHGTAENVMRIWESQTDRFLAEKGHHMHLQFYLLRELGENSIYVIDDDFRGSTKIRSLRPQLNRNEQPAVHWTPYNMVRLRKRFSFYLPLYTFYAVKGLESYSDVIIPNPQTQFNNMIAMMHEGQKFFDVLGYANRFRTGNISSFSNDAIGIRQQVIAQKMDKLVSVFAEIVGSDFVDVFKSFIEDTNALADCRATGFKITKEIYMSCELKSSTRNGKYGMSLNTWRPLMNELVNIVQEIFVPQVSPVSLYVNGIMITKQLRAKLNPAEHIDINDWCDANNPYILIWRDDMLTYETVESRRGETNYLLKFKYNDEELQFRDCTENLPNFLIILGVNTGRMSTASRDFLKTLFLRQKVHFLLPDALVTITQKIVADIDQDFGLEEQCESLLNGILTRRVTITMYNTITSPGRFMNIKSKEKWFFPIQPILRPELVMTGLIDYKNPTQDLIISSPYMWMYGINGDDVRILDINEDIQEPAGRPNMRFAMNEVATQEGVVFNQGQRIKNKTKLGVINFNNPVVISNVLQEDFQIQLNMSISGVIQRLLSFHE